MMKKSIHGLFQARKPKMQFPSCSQNQGFRNAALILVSHPWARQAVFQQAATEEQILSPAVDKHRTSVTLEKHKGFCPRLFSGMFGISSRPFDQQSIFRAC
jgi:hypothetical protein